MRRNFPPLLPAPRTMAEPKAVRDGPADVEIGGIELALGDSWLRDGLFVLRTPEDLRFRYRSGEGVTIDRTQ